MSSLHMALLSIILTVAHMLIKEYSGNHDKGPLNDLRTIPELRALEAVRIGATIHNINLGSYELIKGALNKHTLNVGPS